MFCPQCGAAIEPNSMFCSQCGARLQPAPAPQSPSPEAGGATGSTGNLAVNADPLQQPAAPAPAEQPAASPYGAPTPTPLPAAQPAAPQPDTPYYHAPGDAATPPMQPAPYPGTATPPPVAGTTTPAPAAPTPGAPARDFTKDPRVQEFLKPASLRTIGFSLGIGLASAAIVALISTALIATTSLADASNSMFSQASSMLSMFGGSTSKPGFLHLLVFMLVAGSAGEFSLSASAAGLSMSSAGMDMSITMPLGLPGLALTLGCAFGAYHLARRAAIRFRWIGCAGAVAVGLASAIVYVVLAALLPISSSATAMGMTASVRLSGASARTFLAVFVLSAAGAAAGYALAQCAPASGNVFSAAWHWGHRARGFVRTYVESCAVYAIVSGVCGLLLLIVASFRGSQSLLPFIGLELPLVPFLTHTVSSFGGVALASGSDSRTLTMFNGRDWLGGSWWIPLLLLVVFVIATLYIALRETARNLYDRRFAQWQHAWKYPVAAAVTWLLVTLAFTNLGMTASASGYGSQSASVGVAMWYFIVAAAWAFLVEAIALTCGTRILQRMPQLWRLVAGGVVVVDAAAEPVQGGAPVQDTAAWDSSAAEGVSTGADTFSAAATATAASPMDTATPASAPTGTDIPAPATPATSTPSAAPAPSAQSAAPAPTVPSAMPPAGTAQFPPAVAIERKPMSARTKLRLIIAGIAAGVLIVLFIAYSAVSSMVFTPQAAVDEYLSAIAAGHYDQANKLSNPQVDADQRALMTDKAASGENTTIANARVSNTTKNADGSVTAAVTYTLDGKEVTDNLTVASQGAKFVLFKDWKVTTPLIKQINVMVPETGGKLVINGIEVDTGNAVDVASGTAVFKVYPGSYSVTIPESKYIESDTAKISTNGDAYAALTIQPTSALTDAIQSKIDETLTTCAASTTNEPEGCPFGYSLWGDAEDYRNFAWKITEQPQVDTVSLSSGSFYATSGEAEVTYQYKNWDDEWTDRDGTDYFYLQGTFTIDGDNVTVELSDSNW